MLRRIALLLIGAVLVAGLWIGGQGFVKPAPDSPESSPPTAKDASTAETTGDTGQPSNKIAEQLDRNIPFVRRIAPGSIAGPDVAGPLERVAPRVPLTAATKPLKREPFGPPVPTGTLLYQPVATAAGEIEANGYTMQIAGIRITAANRRCVDGQGRSWPCGVVARTAFRSWMRGRAIACDVPSHRGEITTHCTLDGEDMARWLVENGWAESADGQYDEAERKARTDRKGLFGPSPLADGEQ